MKTKTNCIACLRRTADALEVTCEWLLWDCIHVLHKTGHFGKDEAPYTKDEITSMDLSMARDALEHYVWWLRKAADDWEGDRNGTQINASQSC